MNIINLNTNVDRLKQPIWFGESLSLQRYDTFRYPGIFGLFKNQLSYFWRPEEVDLGKDITDFKSLSKHEKFIFTKNLEYQILLDSIQGRGISSLKEHLSNPECEAFMNSWELMETLHSYSYTHIIRNIYNDSEKVYDGILTDPEIIKRTTSVTKYYDALINKIPSDTIDDLKKKLYLTLMSINILEGVRFYVSFACSYSFAENKKMEGNAKIISLINRDENLHLGFTQKILSVLRTEPSEGFQHIVEECKPIVVEMFRDAATEEIEWCKYLFKDGSLLGLNEEILSSYMKWLINFRMTSIKLEPIFPKQENPINWINNWTASKNLQVAPQETEVESYVVGSFNQDLEKSDFSGFDI